MVLIGANNEINKKLIHEISQLMSVELIEPPIILNDEAKFNTNPNSIILVNLIDAGPEERKLLLSIKEKFQNSKIVAIHTFKEDCVSEKMLINGYDGYISIFNLSEEFYPLMQHLGVV